VVEVTGAGRRRLANGLRELGVALNESLGNFVTVELGTATPSIVDVYRRFGIGVRPLNTCGMTDQVRVTVGTPPQIDTCLAPSTTVRARVEPLA
jgi:histidinol-phosphate/aromatic aminotransferase/cobyric acid decarboxylase-like protein